ncbi:type IIB DNA topoisomerase [Planoprotostelium fungivorum]|uniref:Type IIB DNA topoisomerase n=1 Tax=Planoprotostelium fungivorum TaxID=1890364 RepID=A0A2P6N9T0_9EUKA|nr:type IIB DNA topoisomerase [Planoprotostelium fungivorum]
MISSILRPTPPPRSSSFFNPCHLDTRPVSLETIASSTWTACCRSVAQTIRLWIWGDRQSTTLFTSVRVRLNFIAVNQPVDNYSGRRQKTTVPSSGEEWCASQPPFCFCVAVVMVWTPPSRMILPVSSWTCTTPLLERLRDDERPTSTDKEEDEGHYKPIDLGTDTIFQTDQQHSTKKKFRLQNPLWTDTIDKVLQEAKKTLQIERSVPAELYKLLLYEKGSHFSPHRDSEKTDKMFATMVIVLPTHHTGGDLVIQHGGVKKVYNSSEKSRYDFQYMTFYCDCLHEIKTIDSGYRLALVYDLCYADDKEPITAPKISNMNHEALHEAMRTWQTKSTSFKFLYVVSHRYSQANVQDFTPKSADVNIVEAIKLKMKVGLGSLEKLDEGRPDRYNPPQNYSNHDSWENEDYSGCREGD